MRIERNTKAHAASELVRWIPGQMPVTSLGALKALEAFAKLNIDNDVVVGEEFLY